MAMSAVAPAAAPAMHRGVTPTRARLAMGPLGGAPRPPAPAPAAERRSDIFGRMKNLFRSATPDDAPSAFPAPLVGAPQEMSEASGPSSLRGRVVHRKGSFLIVEADLDAFVRWELPFEVRLELPDGVSVVCEVIRARSTTSGDLEPGQTLRLVLKCTQPQALEPVRVTFQDTRIELA